MLTKIFFYIYEVLRVRFSSGTMSKKEIIDTYTNATQKAFDALDNLKASDEDSDYLLRAMQGKLTAEEKAAHTPKEWIHNFIIRLYEPLQDDRVRLLRKLMPDIIALSEQDYIHVMHRWIHQHTVFAEALAHHIENTVFYFRMLAYETDPAQQGKDIPGFMPISIDE